MPSRLNPYVTFPGQARQAMEFYQGVFGGELSLTTFGEFGMTEPGYGDRIMHGMLETPTGFTLMGSDLPPGEEHRPGNNVTVCLSGDDVEMLRSCWERLSEPSTVSVPLERQMWGDEYGACTDPFGVEWMVDIDLSES